MPDPTALCLSRLCIPFTPFRGRLDEATVCLVTTAEWGDPNAEIIATEWLPRPVAERLAEEQGGFIILHPALHTEAGCEEVLRDF